MEKNARELLEEALTYISLPVALYGGIQLTGWVTGCELDDKHYENVYDPYLFDQMGVEPKLDDKGKPVIEIIDSKVASLAPNGDHLSIQSVCAIGAVSLASLDAESILANKGDYANWENQVLINPEVALASVALAFAVKEARDKENGGAYYFGPACDDFFRKGFDYWLDLYRAYSTNSVNFHDFGSKVEIIGGVITGYNDEQRSWEPVAAIFEAAIKALIEKGF